MTSRLAKVCRRQCQENPRTLALGSAALTAELRARLALIFRFYIRFGGFREGFASRQAIEDERHVLVIRAWSRLTLSGAGVPGVAGFGGC